MNAVNFPVLRSKHLDGWTIISLPFPICKPGKAPVSRKKKKKKEKKCKKHERFMLLLLLLLAKNDIYLFFTIINHFANFERAHAFDFARFTYLLPTSSHPPPAPFLFSPSPLF